MRHIIGFEWNPKFPNSYLIDAEGNPLSLSHDELCEHPTWKNICKEDGVTHIPTIYYNATGRDVATGIFRVWVSDEPRAGFRTIPSFTMVQIGGHARVGNKTNWTLLTPERYIIISWLFQIEWIAWRESNASGPAESALIPRPEA